MEAGVLCWITDLEKTGHNASAYLACVQQVSSLGQPAVKNKGKLEELISSTSIQCKATPALRQSKRQETFCGSYSKYLLQFFPFGNNFRFQLKM